MRLFPRERRYADPGYLLPVSIGPAVKTRCIGSSSWLASYLYCSKVLQNRQRFCSGFFGSAFSPAVLPPVVFFRHRFIDDHRRLGHHLQRTVRGPERQILQAQAAEDIQDGLFKCFFQLVNGFRCLVGDYGLDCPALGPPATVLLIEAPAKCPAAISNSPGFFLDQTKSG